MLVVIQSLMCKLPFNSGVGSDGISAEHICFVDSPVALYLSLFFSMCIVHGDIPKPCINTVIVPILKNKNGNHQDCDFHPKNKVFLKEKKKGGQS